MTELKSNTEWKQWGKDDPLWGVSSWANKQKGGASPWTEEEFYLLGESDWRDCLDHWLQYGVNTESCLEIGCGAGRITRQLATSFDKVWAVDVSEEMIGCAKRAIAGNNVEFSVIDGLHLPQGDNSVQAVFSTHVLQHLDNVEIGFAYFRELYRVLGAGGAMMVHLPLYEFPGNSRGVGAVMQALYSVSLRLSDMRAGMRRRMGVKTMRGTPYPIRALSEYLAALGFRNVEFRIFALKSNADAHPFVFATK